jgi:hypothetical protein
LVRTSTECDQEFAAWRVLAIEPISRRPLIGAGCSNDQLDGGVAVPKLLMESIRNRPGNFAGACGMFGPSE